MKFFRELPMDSLYNVRDLGGYDAHNGTQTKWGVLYRSGDFKNASAHDIGYLEKCNIKTIVDFRDATEKQQIPDAVINSVVNRFELPIDLGALDEILGPATDTVSSVAMMEEMYRLFVSEALPQYHEFFRIISKHENAPLLFHCSAGKDRTGMASMFILSALGVDKKIIYEDYLLTEKCLREKYRVWTERNPGLAPLVSVGKSFLDAAFTAMDEQYGGIERYLVDELGADIEKLRELYTA